MLGITVPSLLNSAWTSDESENEEELCVRAAGAAAHQDEVPFISTNVE